MILDNKIMMSITVLMILCVAFSVNALAAADSPTSGSETKPTNMVVDFDSTYMESYLSPGESGVLNLVIKNTGGRRAENVEVWLTSTTIGYVGRNFYVGRVDAGESKTIPVVIRVDGDAKTGLNTIKVRIEYHGFDSDGHQEYNQQTTWEIPFRVYGEPLFQVSPSKTTYYKDTLDELVLAGSTKTSVKDLEAELSSDCFTVIGSSRQYVGDVEAEQEFNLTYKIKPSSAGACESSLSLSYADESGSEASDKLYIGLIVEEAGVDFKIVGIEYEPTGPGQTMSLNLSVKNVGPANAEDVTLSLSLTDPFTTAETSEKYVGTVGGGETVNEGFKLAVSWDAETKVYSIPLVVSYKVGGTPYSVEKNIGVDVGGQVILEVIEVQSSGGSLKVDVANVGTRAAESVKATLVTGDGTVFTSSTPSSASTNQRNTGGRTNALNFIPGMGRTRPTRTADTGEAPAATQQTMNRTSQLQTYVDYKSDIKATKQTTFTFPASIQGQALLILEYTGEGNERVTQREPLTVGSSGSSSRLTGAMPSKGGTGLTTYLLYGAILLVIVFVGYNAYRRFRK